MSRIFYFNIWTESLKKDLLSLCLALKKKMQKKKKQKKKKKKKKKRTFKKKKQ